MIREFTVHKSVLLNETIESLNLKGKEIILDATFGGGGHSLEIFKKHKNVKIIALDQDNRTWEIAKDKFKDFKIKFYNENFRNLDKVLKKEGIKEVDAVLFDLGLSSDQLEISGRGFSFMKNEPLLMTMKESSLEGDLTARDIVNFWSEENLEKIIKGYGEENFAEKIARRIVEARRLKKIESTLELVEIIKGAVPTFYRKRKIHFATKTFQAIRIAVNDELEALKEGLNKGISV